MKLIVCVTVFLSLLLVTQKGGCGEPRLPEACDPAFALALYRELSIGENNLFLSPSSIDIALSMTMSGAGGRTASQMAQVLHLPENSSSLHNASLSGFNKRLQQIEKKGRITISSANSLWPQKGYHLSKKWLAEVSRYYGAAITGVNYTSATEQARIAINSWVEGRTKSKIRELIKPGILNTRTRLTLVNAVYFKGDWELPFRIQNTVDAPFYTNPYKTVKVPLMFQTGTFGYADLDSLRLLELPYTGSGLSMLILLPKQKSGLKSLEASLLPENLQSWEKRIRKTKLDILLPKFKSTSSFRLDETLKKMGMTDAFSEDLADFSGMVDNGKKLYIGAVIHKAFVDVNEKGTEAAAATAVVMQMKSAMPRPLPLFRADHPFLFMIRENTCGRILFIGRLTDPTVKGE